MNPAKTVAAVLTALIALGLCAVALYYGLLLAAAFLGGLDPSVQAALAAGVALVLGAGVLARGVCGARKFGAEAGVRLAKGEAYAHLAGSWSRHLGGPGGGEFGTAENAAAQLAAFERELLLWGASAVVNRYAAVRPRLLGGDPEAPRLLDGLVREMRADLGRGNAGLAEGVLGELLAGGDTAGGGDGSGGPGRNGEAGDEGGRTVPFAPAPGRNA
jgi:hypothetical protein